MAVATRRENVATLADTNTFDSSGEFTLVLVGGSDTATVSLSVGGSVVIAISALASTTISIEDLKIKGVVTVALTGTAPKAYAIFE